ncbi:3-ketoacyl-ACP reductase [Planotetraspora thailandica]|uniref:3-ketoacyl-ACP reductase n=1 Tax=Planotetraspora thailandica TaxID=487172 RepID=A0A8J3Y2E4_9ACTN|nr:SDR family oxidoreductase [Planotetraspora thailandica]GII59529.1 3-ketoacyl-ACP reductase [Planotetraspora thailandica]
MSGALEGKKALVTGGSRGIGAAIAQRLASDGADVAISHTNGGDSADRAAEVVAAIRGLGRKAKAYVADSGDMASVKTLVDDVAADFNGLDILVNNAGVFLAGEVGPEGLTPEDSVRQIDVNYGGVVAATRAAVAHLPKGGRIVTIGTNAATGRIGFNGLGEYVATKAAVTAYSRGAARDLAPRGITVNVVQLGAINTRMNPEDTEWGAQLGATIPAGRYGSPAEVAAVVAFLAGPESAYVTGTTINVDGGMDA